MLIRSPEISGPMISLMKTKVPEAMSTSTQNVLICYRSKIEPLYKNIFHCTVIFKTGTALFTLI